MTLFVLPSLICLIVFCQLLGFFVKRTSYSTKKKKLVFTLAGAFLSFPILIPAGTISAIPLSNGAAFPVLLYFGGILDTLSWYLRTWNFNLASFFITAAVLRSIAAMVFFEKKSGTDSH